MKTIFKYFLYLILLPIAFACDSSFTDNGKIGDSSTGHGGSMARFAVVQNNLYTVTPNSLKQFDLTEPSLPNMVDSIYLTATAETIFPYGNNLFIGTQNGMKIYDIGVSGYPVELSTYQHITSCDPVVVQDNYAYVTLNSNSDWCNRNVNRLDIIDISNLYNPNRIAEYSMQGPQGLGVDGNLLFVCDNGLRVYDITNKSNIQLKQYFNINATDVIPHNNLLLVTGDDGIYQYSYDGTSLTLLSKIPVEP